MATPVQTISSRYSTLERVMETKALAIGGKSMRKAFFQHLQRMREKSKKEHGQCSGSFRAWMADKLTWDHFFSGERFPGTEPVGKDIHSCRYATSGSHSVALPSNFRPSGQPPSKHSPSNQSHVSILGAYQQKIDCSENELKNLSHIFLIDTERSLVEEAMQCQVQARSRDGIWNLLLIITPYSNNYHPAILKLATDVILDWTKQTLKKPLFKLSAFWMDWSRQNLYRPLLKHETKQEKFGFVSTPACNTSSKNMPISNITNPESGILDSEWQKYADAFGCSMVDRVVIEGQVKAEASLRLVLDNITGDVVTLGELEGRIHGREQSRNKRKAEVLDDIGDCNGHLKKICFS